MQFQVPQFIDTEDKIIGPLSLRQFAYVGVGGILSAMLYFVAQTWLWALGSIFIFGAAFAFAFVKIEGRPFANVIVSAFHFYWKPQTYVWQPEQPSAALPRTVAETEAGRSALEEILSRAKQAVHPTAQVFTEERPISRETVSAGDALHKSWENVQTGAAFAQKNSDKQFLEKKMAERYQIFRRIEGDRNVSRRVDYR